MAVLGKAADLSPRLGNIIEEKNYVYPMANITLDLYIYQSTKQSEHWQTQQNNPSPLFPPKMAEEALFHGRCFCGALSFSITSPPTKVYLCHCPDCQRLTGSAFAHNASFATSAIHMQAHSQASPGWKPAKDNTLVATTQLLLRNNNKHTNDDDPAEQSSGGGGAAELQVSDILSTFGDEASGRQQFCAVCGTRLFVRCRRGIAAMRAQTVVPVGVIDGANSDQRLLAPTAENWAQSRVGWLPGELGLVKRKTKRKRAEGGG